MRDRATWRVLRPVLLAAAFACMAGSAAWADDLPSYDSAAYCRRMSGLTGGASPTLLNECLTGERRARDQLAPRWSRLSATEQAYCDRLSRSAGGVGRYVRLKSCTDRQLALADRQRAPADRSRRRR